MNHKPFVLTPEEIKEIAALKHIQDMWGATNSADMDEILNDCCYMAKFDFFNGSPGYVGDLFVIQSDHLDSDILVTRLVRNREKKLEVLE